MGLRTIIDAWIIANNPDEREKELGELRLEVCVGCEFNKEVIKGVKFTSICKRCGCPIAKKIFTDSFNPCPAGKWSEIDKPFFPEQKTKKTLY